MLCYRCGSHVHDGIETCPACGQKLAAAGFRQATGTFSRRRLTSQQIEGAPYRPQELVASRYLVKDTLGVGPLGFVFRAHDSEADVEVALKSINPKLMQTPEERRHFSKTLRLARKLSHQNLVRVYDEGEDQGRPYFTSQFLDGLSLRRIIDLRLQKGQFFSLREIEPILAQICAALEAAHKLGPHADFKPENVLVLPDLLKVTDFSLGLAIPRLPFTQAMRARKAERYLAPELTEGAEVDVRADLYAVGVVIGEMLAGVTPDGGTPDLGRKNPDVPEAIDALYRKAVNPNPLARFATAGELIAEYVELVRRTSPAPEPRAGGLARTAGGDASPRPRTTTGMLQLEPRRERPPGASDSALPSPARLQGRDEVPFESTQRVDADALRTTLGASDAGAADTPTDSQGSGDAFERSKRLLDRPLQLHDAAARGGQAGEIDRSPSRPLWQVVALLVIAGVILGAGSAYLLKARRAGGAGGAAEAGGMAVGGTAVRRTETPALSQTPDGGVAPGVPSAAVAQGTRELAAVAAPSPTPPLGPPRPQAGEQRAEVTPGGGSLDVGGGAIGLPAAQIGSCRVSQGVDCASGGALEVPLSAAAPSPGRVAASAEVGAAVARSEALAPAAGRIDAGVGAVGVAAGGLEGRLSRLVGPRADQPPGPRTAPPREGAPRPALAAASSGAAGVVVPACPEGMVAIPAGSFKLGTARDDPMMGFDEMPLTLVSVAAFCVDAFEYPNRRGVVPMTSVSFADAERLCLGQGKRLCSEVEWERACKGPASLRWPYGNSFDPAACNADDETGDAKALASAGRFGRCRSPFAVSDLSGNAAEWTAERTIKGGAFTNGDYAVRCSARKNGRTFLKSPQVGFRCCANPR